MSSRRAPRPRPRPRGPGGLLLVVSGPGGAGKTTLCERLAADRRSRVAMSVSATTRAPRRGEADGRHYFFISRGRFERDLAAGRFVEHAEVAGHLYGTPRAFLDAQLAARRDVLLDIDVQGCAAVRRAYPERTVAVFVLPPSLVALKSRLRGRGTDDPKRVRARLELAKREIARAGKYDYLVINARRGEAVADLAAIRRAEHLRLTREGGGAAWALTTWS